MFDTPSYVFIVMLSVTAIAVIWPSASNIIRPMIFQSASRTGAYRWPYPAKFPWSVPSGGYLFYLQYLYQVSTCWWMVFTIGGVDSLFGFYAFQIFSILRAMAVRLANPRPGELFSQVLRTCVETHHHLLRCVHTLEDIYGIIILRTILTNAILMCALIFEASLVRWKKEETEYEIVDLSGKSAGGGGICKTRNVISKFCKTYNLSNIEALRIYMH